MAPIKTFPLPAPRPGVALWLFFLHSAALLGTAVSIHNLFAGFGVVTNLFSALWLVGYFGLWYSNIGCDGGIRSTFSKLLEAFASKHLLEVLPEQRVTVKFFSFGFPLTVLETASSSVLEIEWHPGQASAMLGEDTDDWWVFLRLRSSGVKTLRRRRYLDDDRETFQLTEGLKREKAESLASSLVEFLGNEGVKVSLVPPPADIISQLHKVYEITPTD